MLVAERLRDCAKRAQSGAGPENVAVAVSNFSRDGKGPPYSVRVSKRNVAPTSPSLDFLASLKRPSHDQAGQRAALASVVFTDHFNSTLPTILST